MDEALFDLHARVEERHWWFAGRRRILRAVLERLVEPGEGRLVVDVGCGTGANIASLAPAYVCVGIDTAPPAIERAARRYPAVRFIQGIAPEDLGDAAGRADAFLLMDVIEHTPDDFSVFSAVASAARPGAYLIVTVPALPSLWSEHDVRFGHYRRYTPERFEQVWHGLPLRPLLVSHFNSRLYPVVRAVRTVGRVLGRTAGREGSDLGLPPGPLNRLLEGWFAGERHALLRALADGSRAPYRIGVSLMAVLRREAGALPRRGRPSGIAPDEHFRRSG